MLSAKNWVSAFILFLIMGLSLQAAADIGLSTQEIYHRLTGVRLNSNDPRLKKWNQLIWRGQLDQVFSEIMTSDYFIRNRVATMVSRLTNPDRSPFEDVDDFQISLALSILREADFRDIFFKPFYLATQNRQKASIDEARILEYLQQRQSEPASFIFKLLEKWRLVFPSEEQLVGVGSRDGVYLDGLFSTEGFGRRYFSGGTNRRNIRDSIDLFLCKEMTSYKDSSLDDPHDTFIGMDIDRMKSQGNEKLFEENCQSCHAPMDSLRGAGAKYDYNTEEGRLIRYAEVVPKMNQNSIVYPDGKFVLDDYWQNKLTTPEWQKIFGWRGPLDGYGLLSFSTGLAESEQFDRCMAQVVVENFCGKVDGLANGTQQEVQRLANHFRSQGYVMKDLIKEAVQSPLCSNGKN